MILGSGFGIFVYFFGSFLLFLALETEMKSCITTAFQQPSLRVPAPPRGKAPLGQ
jgi:hypothetical protein